MSRTGATVFGVALAGLALACIGSYSKAIGETRAGVIGLTGKELRKCLGVPTDVAKDEELEIVTYRWESNSERAVTMGNGGILTGPIRQRRPGPWDTRDPGGWDKEWEEPFCELQFELQKGKVASVNAEGRSSEGLNRNGECLLRARPCVPDPDEYEWVECEGAECDPPEAAAP